MKLITVHQIYYSSEKEFGGSTLLVIGIYVFQISHFIFKEKPVKITVVGSVNELDVDYSETVVLEYEGGGSLVFSIYI